MMGFTMANSHVSICISLYFIIVFKMACNHIYEFMCILKCICNLTVIMFLLLDTSS